MRTTTLITLVGIAAITAVTGCTVKDVDQPALAGPSTFTHSIIMTTERNTLTQNGVDFTDIRIVSIGANGQSETIPLTAQIFVDGVAQDFGTLSTKNPVTPTTIRYTAPPASTLAQGQTPSTVTIAVTPTNSGDFRAEVARQIDLRLTPQGVILPSNPNLIAAFLFNPAAPQAFQSITFDASTSTNGGSACGQACSYLWDFGDGSTGTGLTTTHQYRASGNYSAKLTVTDARGAQAFSVQTITVANPAPPTGTFAISPTPPVPVNGDVFFNASNVTWAGRTITSYEWNFGDGTTGTGVTTSHRYSAAGTFNVVLTVTDSLGARGQTSAQPVQVTQQGGATATLAASTTTPTRGQNVVFNATGSTPSTGGTITNYRFIYGDGTTEDSSTPVQSHAYTAAGTYVATVQTTDSNGKTAVASITLTVS